MSGTPAINEAAKGSNNAPVKPQPKRMYSADIAAYIRRFTNSTPNNSVFRIPFRMPKPMFQLFSQIEQLLFSCKTRNEIEALDRKSVV